MTSSPFVFTVCQLDVERDLKREIGAKVPSLRAAFQRPGLVTWKSAGGELPLDYVLPSVLARAYGLSFGRAGNLEEACRVVDSIAPGERAHLHVFPRDTVIPGECDETKRAPGLDDCDAFRDALASNLGGRAFEARLPAEGELVVDIIRSQGRDADEPMIVGAHRHHAGHSPRPGGRLDVVLPPTAPSRAYLKALDGFDFAGEPFVPGRVAVEIGSAPGGAVFAMLERGMRVVGVDPGAMDARVLAMRDADPSCFTHLSMPVGAVREDLLPAQVDYLLLDANLAPQVAFRSALRLAAMRKKTLRALIFTLKMNDWHYLANLDGFTERARELGFDDIRARQLGTNRKEVCFVARRRLPRGA